MIEITAVLAVPASAAVVVSDLTLFPHDPRVVPAHCIAGNASERRSEDEQAISFGVVCGPPGCSSNTWAAWGDCVPGPQSPSRKPRTILPSCSATIRDIVAPALVGHELTSFREVSACVDALTHEVRVLAPDAGPEERGQSGVRSLTRRDLMTAPFRLLQHQDAGEERAGPQGSSPERYTSTRRSLPAPVRHGISQALLGAVARATQLTMAEVIAQEWHLPEPRASVPVQATCAPDRPGLLRAMMVNRVDALGCAVTERYAEGIKGEGTALVQDVHALARQLDEWVDESYHPIIHIDVRGAAGRLYERNLGQVLGYLHRLESAARPYPLRVEDPVIAEDRSAQIETLRTLREYVRFRRMPLTLVAHAWVTGPEDVQAFADADAADAVRIDLSALGGIHTTVEVALRCQAAGIGVLLADAGTGTGLSERAAAHVALAVRPDTLVIASDIPSVGPVTRVRAEMARSLALIARCHRK